MDRIVSVNLDSAETAFFARELEYIKSKSYDIEFPPLKATKLIPVSTDSTLGIFDIKKGKSVS